VEGVGAQTADNLLAWAQEKAGELTAVAEEPATAAPAAAPAEAPAEPQAAASSTMGDEDFMAALSRAFQESEALRQSVAERTEEHAEEGGDGAATDEGGNDEEE